MTRSQVLAAGMALAGAAVFVAQAAGPAFADPPFNVRPGLWEMRSSGTTKGQVPLPPEALARLSPKQRARIEATMQSAIAHGNADTVRKSCITAEQLRRGPSFGDDPKSCTRTVAKRTATEIEVHAQCAGERRQLDVHFRAVTPERISGTVDAVVSNGGRTMTVHRQVSGTWLAADCGTVKPGGR